MVVHDIFLLGKEYDVVAILDDDPGRMGENYCGIPVVGGRAILSELRRSQITHFLVAAGDCQLRLSIAELAMKSGFELATAIHPSGVIARCSRIGEGTVVAAGAIVAAGVEVGKNVIINTASSVDHQTCLDDGVHLCPGIRLAGNVIVERGATIGIGATVKENVRVGAAAFVGAGSVVLSDIPGAVIAYGNPCRVGRERAELGLSGDAPNCTWGSCPEF